ncbi:hypothetical protein BD413DRAFT_541751 [Trametes elegans]|nr:hypothetical protein BD413DRAFT_541751 [Trametes elegans]
MLMCLSTVVWLYSGSSHGLLVYTCTGGWGKHGRSLWRIHNLYIMSLDSASTASVFNLRFRPVSSRIILLLRSAWSLQRR